MTAIKSIAEKVVLTIMVFAFTLAFVAPKAYAATYYYNQGDSNAAYIQSLVRQINALLAQLERSQSRSSVRYVVQNGNHGRYSSSDFDRPYIPGWNSSDDNDDDDNDGNDGNDDNDDEDTPEASTDDAEDVEETTAEIHGEISMNDYEDGIAFFVYGEDEDAVEDVEDESEYNDVDQDGDNIRKILLRSNLDDDRSFSARLSGLDEDTDHFFRICVQYDDEDDDETLVCGDVESFTTDEN
ncbi:MAG: hypothetical protein RLZZ76_395 [Candidatus Parcubacteria bacterium]|jgi:uncharacterized protein (DUF2164 family)